MALVTRRKAGPKKVEELSGHLEAIGIRSSTEESDATLAAVGCSWGEKHMGTLKFSGRSMDAINIVGASSQYGTQYWLDFLVHVAAVQSVSEKKRTWIVRKKTPALWGKVTDVEWKGDESLSRRLNFDYRLRDSLKVMDENLLRGGVSIFAGRKHGWARVRTKYFLPTRDTFEAIGAICRHVKLEW